MNGAMLFLFACFRMAKENFSPYLTGVRGPRGWDPALRHSGYASLVEIVDLQANSLNCTLEIIIPMPF